MLWEHERNYGVGMDGNMNEITMGMDALVIVGSGNMNEIMVWAWMLWSSYALGPQTRLWFGHGCFGHRMLWEHERDYGLGMDALVIVCSGNMNEITMGMDALVIVGSGNMNEIMVWAWMLWSSYALGTQTRLWFEHGCSGHRRLWEHERDSGLGMDALVIVGSGNVSSYALGTPGCRKCCAGCAERQLASC